LLSPQHQRLSHLGLVDGFAQVYVEVDLINQYNLTCERLLMTTVGWSTTRGHTTHI